MTTHAHRSNKQSINLCQALPQLMLNTQRKPSQVVRRVGTSIYTESIKGHIPCNLICVINGVISSELCR